MTNSEYQEKVASSIELSLAKKVLFVFDFPYVNIELEIVGLSAIFKYVNQQIRGWEKVEDGLPKQLLYSLTYFKNLKEALIKVLSEYPRTEPYFNNYLKSIQNRFANTTGYPIPYNTPEAEFLRNLHKEYPQYFSGAFNFLIGNKTPLNLNSKELLFGSILAYEFSQKDSSKIIERRNAEKSSISKIRNDFEKYLTESEENILGLIKNTNDKYEEYAKKVDNLKNEKEALFNNWFEDVQTSKWQNWYDPTLEKIKELEETYKEKLKLEEPAKYWSLRAKSLKTQGWITVCIIIVLVGIVSYSLGKILVTVPDHIYASWFGSDQSAAIRWSIIYITLITFIAFLIRALTKFMFSCFHLSRDCEERHTLTYFYLSLLKDSNVNEQDRQLIMQSLFSRAETGLLKDDASPTMPNEAIGKFFGK